MRYLFALFLLLPLEADEPPISSTTHVVLVNVVVKDKHGKPVDDLTRDDFVVRDNGRKQKIALFAREENSAVAATPRQPLTFTNRPAAGMPSVTVFLFDELNTSLADQQLARKDFLRYLGHVPADSRVAVFVLGDSLVLLHDFSEDVPSLVAALNRHASRVNREVEASTAPTGSAHSLAGDQNTDAKWDSFIRASSRAYVDYEETVRALRTAAALETIAGHLEGIPGRKTLIWISGGFPVQLGLHASASDQSGSDSASRSPAPRSGFSAPRSSRGGGGTEQHSSGGNSTTQPPPVTSTSEIPGQGQSFESEVERAIGALNEADIAVYPVDARGLNAASRFDAERSSLGKRNKPPKAAPPPDYNYETLETLAEETGGKPFHDINDLSAAIQEAISDARVSYSLAFSPPSDTLDGAYHRLEVAVNRPGAKLRYRPRYLAARDSIVAPPLASAIQNPVSLTGIGMTVHLEPTAGGYKTSVTLDSRDITLQPASDGKWTGSLEFLVVVGRTEQLTRIPLSLNEATFRSVEQRGLTLGARVKTPPGTTGFSLGFRDVPSGLTGTLHIGL